MLLLISPSINPLPSVRRHSPNTDANVVITALDSGATLNLRVTPLPSPLNLRGDRGGLSPEDVLLFGLDSGIEIEYLSVRYQ